MIPSDFPFPYLIPPNRAERAAAREKKEEKFKARKAKEQARMDSYPRGVGLTVASHDKIIEVILAILKNDADYAFFVNGVGFSAGDSKIFHEIFDKKPYCDDHTLMLHCHRLKKYRSQYKALGFTDDDIIPKFKEPRVRKYDLNQFL